MGRAAWPREAERGNASCAYLVTCHRERRRWRAPSSKEVPRSARDDIAMNYLAHLFLARDDAESLIGNLAGDFVKGPLRDRFTPGIRDGIMQHRHIDAFTDTHPQVAAFRRVLIPDHGHYARIISD